MATTRSRSREGLASISLSNPRRRMAVSTASTWPCACERTTSSALSSGPSFSPFSTRRIISACSIGNAERLAMVRFLTRLPSRMLSRSKIAGGDPRLGTMSMYMNTIYAIRVPSTPESLRRIHGHNRKLLVITTAPNHPYIEALSSNLRKQVQELRVRQCCRVTFGCRSLLTDVPDCFGCTSDSRHGRTFGEGCRPRAFRRKTAHLFDHFGHGQNARRNGDVK